MSITTHLLIIDPQNDFMDVERAALPVIQRGLPVDLRGRVRHEARAPRHERVRAPRPPAPAASHYRRRHKQPTPAHGIIIIDNTIRSRTPDRDPPRRPGRLAGLGPAPWARARLRTRTAVCAARCVMNDVNLD
jgi:hypothetical protein